MLGIPTELRAVRLLAWTYASREPLDNEVSGHFISESSNEVQMTMDGKKNERRKWKIIAGKIFIESRLST